MKSEYKIRLSKKEMEIIKKIAKRNKHSISYTLKGLILDKLYEELDEKIINDYEKLKKQGKLNLRPINDLWNELNI